MMDMDTEHLLNEAYDAWERAPGRTGIDDAKLLALLAIAQELKRMNDRLEAQDKRAMPGAPPAPGIAR